MNLTPLYEALIFIENQGPTKIDELNFLPKPVLRGILGKMEAMKLIEKTQSNDFKISAAGQKLLNRYLDNLHKSTLHWDSLWRLVSFSIPESKRPLRDKFRRALEKSGLKMVLSGLWITPLNIVQQIKNTAIETGVYSNVVITETSVINTGITQEELINLWNFKASRKEIYEFIEEANQYLISKQKSSFETKKMIFRYALVLENQPKLPIELFPTDWPQFRANLTYKKIRRLLV